MGVVELAGRIPIQLSPSQTRLALIAVVGVLIGALIGGLIEALFGGVTGAILKLTGHPPPRKSSFRMALDELDARLNKKPK